MNIRKIVTGVAVATAIVWGGADAFAEPVTTEAGTAQSPATQNKENIDKVLFIGDSMTGWMAERLNAYGHKNGFSVATIIWDGSTIKKWGNSSDKLTQLIQKHQPDVVFISLGMNELFESNPEKALSPSLKKLLEALGDTPYLWIGPPSWPGHSQGSKMTGWLNEKLGKGHFFNSLQLQLPRQSKTNPHPSRAGMCKWIDAVADWIPENTDLHFKGLESPADGAMSRGKVFIYKRMKESL